MSTTAPFRGRIGCWQWVLESEWPAVWQPDKWNWTDFTFIRATVERVRYLDDEDGKKAWDVWLGLLGFVFGISNCYGYAHDDSDNPIDQPPAPPPSAPAMRRGEGTEVKK